MMAPAGPMYQVGRDGGTEGGREGGRERGREGVLSVGAYGGRKGIMSMVAPAGPMHQVRSSTPSLPPSLPPFLRPVPCPISPLSSSLPPSLPQAGTLSGNPLAMTAGIKTLDILKLVCSFLPPSLPPPKS